MSNVDGRLECLNDGTGRVTADVSGTGVAVHAVVSLNGQDGRELGPGNHSYTLTATFPQGTEVFLNIQRDGGEKLLKVLTVDCPQPVPTTTIAPTPSAPPAVTGQTATTTQPRETPTLPETGSYVAPALASGSIILVAGIVIAAVGSRLQRRREARSLDPNPTLYP